MQKNHIFIGAVVIAVVALCALFGSDMGTAPADHALTLMRFKASKPKLVLQNAPIAARVNGEIITVEEIKKGYDDNPQIAEQVSFDDFYKKALDVFVNGKMLYQAAVKAKTMDTPEYEEQLKIAKEDLARKVFMDEAVEARVTPSAIQAFYENEYISKFQPQKEMNAKHILVDDASVAREIIQKLKDGADFDALAKEYTKDKIVELGYFTEDLMVPEFISAVKNLKVGEYTKEPVQTQFGYHVVLLLDVRDSSPLPLPELEPQIKNILSQQAIAEIFDTLHKNSKVEKFDLQGNPIVESEPQE